MLDRRSFLMLAGAPAVSIAAQTPAPEAGPPSAAALFTDPDFGFTAQIALGGSYYRAGDPGRLLAVLSRIKPGDFESAWTAFHDAGVEARALAEQAQSKGHKVSAREAYLWAASNFCSALRLGDGAKDPERMLPCWKEQAACWSAAAALLDPPAERIEIPYEGTKLSSWFLQVDNSRRRRPLVILNNGADGLENRMLALGGAGALERGYNCLIFNGPGQGDSLWARKLYFRPDWEKVITPVVDTMLRHPEVDAKRMALIGVSQGGYWVPRALAFEHRIAAGVADPGVWDVSEPWMRNFPQVLRDMLRDGSNKATFDQIVGGATAKDPRAQAASRMRMRPYGTDSYYDVFRAVQEYRLEPVAGQITCPMLITDPESEQFFPGQARKLHDALRCPKKLIRFTREQGADQHCEAGALGYRDYCIYNWLDETLA
jgi:hypothetical protein